MKRISILLATLAFWSVPGLRAQDAATEERINKLAGRLEDVSDAQKTADVQIRAQLQSLAKDIDSLREQMSKPGPSYASQDDLKRLADAVKEIDRKRMDDNEKLRAELKADLKRLAGIVAAAPPPFVPPTKSHPQPEASPTTKAPEDSYDYVIQKGDNLALIIQKCKEKGVKVTKKQILDANPGLNPDKLLWGKKLIIPGSPAQ